MSRNIYIILIILTLLAYTIGYFELISSILVGVLLLSTFIKAQLVADHFMELKDVQLTYRLIPTIWLVLVLGLVGVAYYFPLVA